MGANPYSTPISGQRWQYLWHYRGGGGRAAAAPSISTISRPEFSPRFTSSSLRTGSAPYAALIDDGKGALYSTAANGGVNQVGSVWSWNYHTNTFKTLYSFLGTTDGISPAAGLVLASDGNLYGVAGAGGTLQYGTAFVLGTDGSNFQVFHGFTNGADGGSPGDLVEYSDGNLYGINNSGGS